MSLQPLRESGALGGIQTPNLLIRSQKLCSVELRVHVMKGMPVCEATTKRLQRSSAPSLMHDAVRATGHKVAPATGLEPVSFAVRERRPRPIRRRGQ